jgi:hypothetical protein
MEWYRVTLLLLKLLWLAISISAQTTPTSTQTYPYVHNSVFSALSSECVSVISACAPTISSCAVSLCEVCTSLSITPSIEPCCAAATPTVCFSSYLVGKPNTYATPSGPLSTGITTFDPSALACESASSIISTCEASTPGFLNLEFSSMFTCLCSSSGKLAPSVYDGFYSTCLAWVSTASPAEYSNFEATPGEDPVRTPCQYFVQSGSTAFPTTSLPPTPSTSMAATTPKATGATTSSTSKSSGICRSYEVSKV